MSKKKNNSKKKQTQEKNKKNEEQRITLEALDAMSSSDDDGGDVPESQLDAKAKNLRQAISEGKFDQLLEKLKKKGDDDDDDEIEEVSLGSDSDEEDDKANEKEAMEEEEVENSEEDEDDKDDGDDSSDEEAEVKENKGVRGDVMENSDSSDDESKDDGNDNKPSNNEESEDDDDDDEEEADKSQQLERNNQTNSKALSVVTAEIVASHARLPWAEKFDIIPPTPLPFGATGAEGESPLDIHDDLKREVAFYNTALEAVHEARRRCKTFDIPFSRPEDFFAEMVKTDDHMAKVKDKLIFETKKMEAVAQRKANREQKLRAKESQANKQAEKAKRKKDHFKNVEEWANNAANNRGGALRDDLDDMYLNRAPSKKRQAADRKYGYGGKKGRFKQNDRSTLNDVSGFNPRGNFPGMGTKKTGGGKGGAGAGRQGKRARDAKRARKN